MSDQTDSPSERAEVENPYRAPRDISTHVDLSRSQAPEIAGLWRRFLGRFIDELIVTTICWIILITILLRVPAMPDLSIENIIFLAAAGNALFVGFIGVLILAVNLLIFTALNFVLLKKYGQTIGKRICNTQIVLIEEATVPGIHVTLLIREGVVYLAAIFGALGSLLRLMDVLVIFGREHRCVHDHIAGTQVVRFRPSTVE